MAATTAGYEWNHSSPLRSSPDTTSPMYPDRPIRPLPKRRLRTRLSPEQADAVIYPPAPPSSGPLFSFPYPAEARGNVRVSQRRGDSDHHACHCGHNHSEVESEEDEDDRAAALPSSPSYHYSRGGSTRSGAGAGGAYAKPGSTASSIDGYESFENTNNKKKRKIPNMGGTSTHTNLSAELANMGIAHAQEAAGIDDGDGPGRYYGSAPSTPQHSVAGTGISGAGRGRFGRSASSRSERRVLASSTSIANAKANTKRPPEGGIISTAIANAQATPPPPGNENVSLLQQEASKGSGNKTQFTFTCGSDSANKMAWPGGAQQNPPYPGQPNAAATPPPPAQQSRARPPLRPDAPNVATHGTQTSPNMNGAPHPPAGKNPAPPKPNQQAPPPRKPRRSASKLYAYAARKRRMQQEYANMHNYPANPWICEFCEYEDIFGVPPVALIRQYEIKDRKERQRLAEKRRLLEKARMKGRKGKKNPPAGGYDNRRVDDGPLDGQDYDDYDDEYDDVPPQAPLPGKHCDHPGCHHHPHHKPPAPGDARGGRTVANGA
ncbi:hypothetical protein P154DRAFT_38023 [Amniculicola lignicola CBS 123094]|uniref:Uncharacterized protein n=1 Tax=Amniculicola lignicola CBS 123094 TaxID=1392246 RepID=A0A6A5VZY8_9PLEO|nr:hypothetical protein P154DRAFT_38023 [Amniculicola lignicola CBS 123094]